MYLYDPTSKYQELQIGSDLSAPMMKFLVSILSSRSSLYILQNFNLLRSKERTFFGLLFVQIYGRH